MKEVIILHLLWSAFQFNPYDSHWVTGCPEVNKAALKLSDLNLNWFDPRKWFYLDYSVVSLVWQLVQWACAYGRWQLERRAVGRIDWLRNIWRFYLIRGNLEGSMSSAHILIHGAESFLDWTFQNIKNC